VIVRVVVDHLDGGGDIRLRVAAFEQQVAIIHIQDAMLEKIRIGMISALYWKSPLYMFGVELSRFSASVELARISTQGASSGKYPAGRADNAYAPRAAALQIFAYGSNSPMKLSIVVLRSKAIIAYLS
jgi:hypothetical protein